MILLTGRGVTDDSRYNISAFNHAEGTAGYAENGFCLYQLIDDIYGTFGFSLSIDLRRSYGIATDTVNFETGAF